jgi:hypothetical protein
MMVTEALKRVVDQVEQLPPEEQDAIAELIERELADRKWEELLASPESDRYLARLQAEARREDASGLTQDSADRW